MSLLVHKEGIAEDGIAKRECNRSKAKALKGAQDAVCRATACVKTVFQIDHETNDRELTRAGWQGIRAKRNEAQRGLSFSDPSDDIRRKRRHGETEQKQKIFVSVSFADHLADAGSEDDQHNDERKCIHGNIGITESDVGHFGSFRENVVI